MERTGASRRIPAAILDGVFILILIVIGLAVYGSIGGAQLAREAQRALGIPVSWKTFASEEVWRQYERRSEEMVRDIERMIARDFTPQQAEFIGRTIADSMEDHFSLDNLSIQFFLDLDEDDLDNLVDHAFDSVIEAGKSDIDPRSVNALRDEVKEVMAGFGVGTIVPQAIDFAIWLLFLPVFVILIYGLAEGVSGRSAGKLILGIAVRRDNAERAYAGTCLLRYTIKNSPLLLMTLALMLRSIGLAVVSGVSLVVMFIGVLVMIGPERRAIYDFLSGTAVYRVVRRED